MACRSYYCRVRQFACQRRACRGGQRACFACSSSHGVATRTASRKSAQRLKITTAGRDGERQNAAEPQPRKRGVPAAPQWRFIYSWRLQAEDSGEVFSIEQPRSTGHIRQVREGERRFDAMGGESMVVYEASTMQKAYESVGRNSSRSGRGAAPPAEAYRVGMKVPVKTVTVYRWQR